jgi:hypothetical protein
VNSPALYHNSILQQGDGFADLMKLTICKNHT